MKGILIILVIVLLFGCSHYQNAEEKFQTFEKEFRRHITSADSVINDGDGLAPRVAHLKNGKPIGFEFRAGPEMGIRYERYFLNDKSEIIKIVIRNNYYNEYNGEPYDSIIVIEPKLNIIKAFTAGKDNIKLSNERIANYLIDPSEYLKLIMKDYDNHSREQGL